MSTISHWHTTATAISTRDCYSCPVTLGITPNCDLSGNDTDLVFSVLTANGKRFTLSNATVANVSGLNQKRVWTHVTNADHAQVTMTFEDGVQAIFTNSDLAAATKPKFYILGTEGAIVGNWDPSAIDAPADLPAIITLHRADGSSEVIAHTPLAPYSFHSSLVSYLNNGTPMTVNAVQSRDVVAIMEAAELSALSNGKPVEPTLLRS